jgi:hypothetical protein
MLVAGFDAELANFAFFTRPLLVFRINYNPGTAAAWELRRARNGSWRGSVSLWVTLCASGIPMISRCMVLTDWASFARVQLSLRVNHNRLSATAKALLCAR